LKESNKKGDKISSDELALIPKDDINSCANQVGPPTSLQGNSGVQGRPGSATGRRLDGEE
jgi:hypothetical protein